MVRVQFRVWIRISGRVKGRNMNVILNRSCLPLQTRRTRQGFVFSIGDFVNNDRTTMPQAYLEGGTIIKSSPYRCGL